MQRCLFFICTLMVVVTQTLSAQNPMVYTLDFYINNLNDSALQARTEVAMPKVIGDSVVFSCSAALNITKVQWKEGRVKGTLAYKQQATQLKVPVPSQNGQNLTLLITYSIQLNKLGGLAFVIQNKNLLVLNPTALYNSSNLGFAGMLFPAIADKKAVLKTNISFPVGLSAKALGKQEFVVTQNNQEISTFYSTTIPMNPALFYLVVGYEDNIEPDEIDETYSITELSAERLVELKYQRALNPVMAYWQDNNFTPSANFYERLEQLQDKKAPQFFINHADVPTIAVDEYNVYTKAFLVWQDFDTARASSKFTAYIQQTMDTVTFEALLTNKWQNTSTPSEELLAEYKALYLQKNANRFTAQKMQDFLNALEADSLPKVQVRYQFVGGKNQQQLLFEQDTATTKLYAIPFQYKLLSKDTLVNWTEEVVRLRVQDTAFIPSNQAPFYVTVHFGSFFPGKVYNQKPDSYSLYQLSSAETAKEREEALEQLFNTQNANLYSTVVGIALRDSSETIRAKALAAAERLNAAGANKVKAQLLKLAEQEPNVALKEKAKALVSKYYGG